MFLDRTNKTWCARGLCPIFLFGRSEMKRVRDFFLQHALPCKPSALPVYLSRKCQTGHSDASDTQIYGHIPESLSGRFPGMFTVRAPP